MNKKIIGWSRFIRDNKDITISFLEDRTEFLYSRGNFKVIQSVFHNLLTEEFIEEVDEFIESINKMDANLKCLSGFIEEVNEE